MEKIALVFTAVVGLLIVWQFLAEKGRKNHVIRGLLILILSIPPAILNTFSRFSRSENILNSPSVLIHIVLGSFFWLTVLVTILTGIYLLKTREGGKRHKISAYSIIALFVIMFLVPRIMRIF